MPKNNSNENRARRRTDAEARQTERNARSVGQHEAILDQRPGASARERARLSKKND